MKIKSPPTRKRVPALLSALAAVALLVTACASQTSTDSQQSTPTPAATSPYSVPDGAQRTGPVPSEAESGQQFSLKSEAGDDGGIDFAAYDAAIDGALGAINEYWAETMPKEFGIEWVQPDEFIAYYPPEDNGPTCGGEQIGPNNAVYCLQGDSDFIAWDEPGLLLPFYTKQGDMADAVILAHEFGHGVQARLGTSNEFEYSIDAELQADCFAGSWAMWADEQGMLSEDAVNQAIDAVVSIADPEGVPWNAPDAHGNVEERLEAFAEGADGGAQACVEQYQP